ncbi:hypothetical protein AB4090_07330 [Acidithiobacillus sp. IBUN Pt1247-S3]|uniref:hypothetical protein n=1 Tax=Acidithiobacillus sp. IBUN Pt1247-S3 TaxID=3166642 RepID=UPI0034E437D9
MKTLIIILLALLCIPNAGASSLVQNRSSNPQVLPEHGYTSTPKLGHPDERIINNDHTINETVLSLPEPIKMYFVNVIRSNNKVKTETDMGWFDLFTELVTKSPGQDIYLHVMAHYPDIVIAYTGSVPKKTWPLDVMILPRTLLRDMDYEIIKSPKKPVPLDRLVATAGSFTWILVPKNAAPLKKGKAVYEQNYGYGFSDTLCAGCHLTRPQFYPRVWQGAEVFAASRPEQIHKDKYGNLLWPAQESRDVIFALLVNPRTGAIRAADPADVACTYSREDASNDLD